MLPEGPDVRLLHTRDFLTHFTHLGIGVRIGVYIQAFVATLSLLIGGLERRPLIDSDELWKNAAQAVIPPLLSGMAHYIGHNPTAYLWT